MLFDIHAFFNVNILIPVVIKTSLNLVFYILLKKNKKTLFITEFTD